MSCDGCRSKVEKTLNAIAEVQATITLDPPIATIIMDKHIPTNQLQEVLSAAGNYTITMNNTVDSPKTNEKPIEKSCCGSEKIEDKPVEKSCCGATNQQGKSMIFLPSSAQGKYYCPMHCEGDKVYDKMGSCPVCGMNLEKVPELTVARTMYTCPMHPEVIKDGPGSCPICGMDLVPISDDRS